MRLLVARCEVTYSGRLHAFLPEAVRLLMIKSDGSVLVHADSGGGSRVIRPRRRPSSRPRRAARSAAVHRRGEPMAAVSRYATGAISPRTAS